MTQSADTNDYNWRIILEEDVRTNLLYVNTVLKKNLSEKSQ